MEVKNWLAVKGDETLALDWDLNENSHVWEIGGFEGRWAQQIWDKFHCNIEIFEPQQWAVERLQKRFEGIEKIKIHPYGLWTRNIQLTIKDFFTDGASVMKPLDIPSRGEGVGDFRDIHEIIAEKHYHVDVSLMNIEGAEYVLIPYLMKDNAIRFFRNFWCQFHPGLISDDVAVQFELSNEIFKQMNDTHDLLWTCFPTAVAWRLRE